MGSTTLGHELRDVLFRRRDFSVYVFWPETLQDAHNRAHPGANDAIPHGVIFASFMAIMAIGALSFNLMVADQGGGRQQGSTTRYALTPTLLLKGALLTSATCFFAAAFLREEIALFISFLSLEVCNGIYVPSVAVSISRDCYIFLFFSNFQSARSPFWDKSVSRSF